MSVQMTMQAQLYSVQNSTGPDGKRYVKAFIGMKVDADDPNTKGLSLMSITAEPVVFDTLQLPAYPAAVELSLVPSRGGMNKMKYHVVAIKPLSAAAK